jgi:hypothetical protein
MRSVGQEEREAHTSNFVEPEIRCSRQKPKAWAAEFGLDASERRSSLAFAAFRRAGSPGR